MMCSKQPVELSRIQPGINARIIWCFTSLCLPGLGPQESDLLAAMGYR